LTQEFSTNRIISFIWLQKNLRGLNVSI